MERVENRSQRTPRVMVSRALEKNLSADISFQILDAKKARSVLSHMSGKECQSKVDAGIVGLHST